MSVETQVGEIAPEVWVKDVTRKGGGRWRCVVKRRAAWNRFRAKKRLPVLMRTLFLLDRKTAALVKKAADDRPTANQHEKRMALDALIRRGQI
jgi:hypothetical protein